MSAYGAPLFLYARGILGHRWYEAEPYIIENPQMACIYARDIIRDRWPESEPIIIQDQNWICHYAKYVIRGRWPEAEPYLNYWIKHYMKTVFWPDVLDKIKKRVRKAALPEL